MLYNSEIDSCNTVATTVAASEAVSIDGCRNGGTGLQKKEHGSPIEVYEISKIKISKVAKTKPS